MSLVIDIQSTSLTDQDKQLLSHPDVLGLILFSRNFENKTQLKKLNESIKNINSDLKIMVDQEGGRVARFREGFYQMPAMGEWGKQYQTDPVAIKEKFQVALTGMLQELTDCYIDVDFIPVLDLDMGLNTVIGDRSFGSDVDIIINLATIAIDVLHEFNMPAIGKHFPGHGHVDLDSHLALPIDKRPYEEIYENDMQPFIKLINKLDGIMPAHIVYEKVDDKPTGFSQKWLQTILRKDLGFNGFVVSDDISMEGAASQGDYPTRIKMAREAGCDWVLACNDRASVLTLLDREQACPLSP